MINEKGQFIKGHKPWNTGKPHSVETRAKIGAIHRGKKMSEEAKRKIGLNGFHYGMKGKKHSIKTKELMSIAQRGERSRFWEGGKTEFHGNIRRSFIYRQIIREVIERDDFTCKTCGTKGGVLHVNHIKPFSLILRQNNVKTLEDAFLCDELWDKMNLETLCIDCHKKTPSYLKGRQTSQPQPTQQPMQSTQPQPALV